MVHEIDFWYKAAKGDSPIALAQGVVTAPKHPYEKSAWFKVEGAGAQEDNVANDKIQLVQVGEACEFGSLTKSAHSSDSKTVLKNDEGLISETDTFDLTSVTDAVNYNKRYRLCYHDATDGASFASNLDVSFSFTDVNGFAFVTDLSLPYMVGVVPHATLRERVYVSSITNTYKVSAALFDQLCV